MYRDKQGEGQRHEAQCEKCGITYELAEGTPCPKCGHTPDAPPLDYVRVDNELPLVQCPVCRTQFMGRPGDRCPKCGRQLGEREGIAWDTHGEEHRSTVGAMVRTLIGVHFRPARTFAGLRREQRDGPPMAFVVLFIVGISLLVATVSGALWRGDPEGALFALGIAIVVLRIFYYLFLRALAGITHILLRCFRVEGRTLTDSYAVYACGFVSSFLWLLGSVVLAVVFAGLWRVPRDVRIWGPRLVFRGGIFWNCAITARGLSVLYKTTLRKTAPAVLIALLVVTLLFGYPVIILHFFL